MTVEWNRRQWLNGVLVSGLGTWGAGAWAQGRAPSDADGRLVLVFLRGACDSLSVWVPYADAQYGRLRQKTFIPPPDGTRQTALNLDATFALHPALADLMPLWQQGVLSFVPATGLPTAVRSHFEAQTWWETGTPGRSGGDEGWMNRWGQRSLRGQGAGGGESLLSVGEANPLILRGRSPARRVPSGKAATQAGALGNDRTQQALMDLYAQSPELNQAFKQGSSSRMNAAKVLEEADIANNGAGNSTALPTDARHLVTLMNQNPHLRTGFLSVGGWDTHANQGAVNGQLASRLSGLAQALVVLRSGLSRPNDAVVVVSEFGRTAAENGTGGTDHGHGSAMWLMGNRVAGGRWHGRWQGLAQWQLNEKRELPVLHDYRVVLSLVMQRTQGLTENDLAAIFPDNPYLSRTPAADHAALSGLIRA